MLWNRSNSNIEPSAYNPSAAAPAAAAPAAAKVTLTARDDRDLGDKNDAGSGRPDLMLLQMTGQGQRESVTRPK